MAGLFPLFCFLFFFIFFFCLMPTEEFGGQKMVLKPVYVFGDSLADVGNNNHLLTLIKADFSHNGVDFVGGKPTGRFSNGKNVVDFLAEKVGLSSPPPYLAITSSNKSEAFLNGVNFASGGAGIFDSTHKGECLSFNKQIDYLSIVYSSIVEKFGAAQAISHLSNAIFIIIIGSNDILLYVSKNEATPQQFVASLLLSLQSQLQKLYNLGARKFVFAGTGPLGCCPALRSQNKTGDCNPLANYVSDLYNDAAASLLQKMKSQLNDINYSFLDTCLALLDLIQNPLNYAEKLGLPSPPPYLAIASTPNNSELFFSGVNFASGGAGILDSTNKGQCLSLNKQIDYFSTTYSSMAEQSGALETQSHLSKSIFAILIGSNDIFSYLKNSKTSQFQFVGSLISTLQLQLKKMYNFGARKFVFIGAGPLGCCPNQRTQNKTGDCVDSANLVSNAYNQAVASLLQDMKSQLNDLNYSFFNTHLALSEIIHDSANYGFSELKAACCGLGNLNARLACTPISSLCSNRKNHLFWDLYHPTEAAAATLIAEAVDGTSPLVYPLNARQLIAL